MNEYTEQEHHDHVHLDHQEEQPEEKPTFLGKTLGRGSRFTSSGKQVEYVNRVLNVEGDQYVLETVNAVKDFQRGLGLPATGRVDEATYEKL